MREGRHKKTKQKHTTLERGEKETYNTRKRAARQRER